MKKVNLNSKDDMTAIDWTNLYKQYKGQWVALKDDEVTVISNGKVLKIVIKEAANKGFDNPILFKVPAHSGTYIGSV